MIIQGFDTREFVSKNLYERYGDNHIWFIKPQLIGIGAWIKFHTQTTVTINDWVFGGVLNFRGYREHEYPFCATDSQHKLSNAIDVSLKNYEIKDLIKLIETKFTDVSKFGLTTIKIQTQNNEPIKMPKFLHLDCRFTDSKELFKVYEEVK